ncbi:hypothetical protein PG994_002243 [Apiospora phragmitis]|uniref:Uncharacterized protein n=1 Tax=Apiospora phragmitis TaxID=2905665 RepID=A0ABR1WVS4_9PEZI
MFALISVLLATLVAANTEKAIFLAPNNINIPSTHPNLDDLQVDTLTPDNWAIRTYLEAQFPTDSTKYGKPTWLVLDQLTEGQRYEVRVCWAATQPTAFVLNTYELQTVFESAELITELSDYSLSRHQIPDRTLMNEVPPVYVDIILDPYVFNLLPRSLLPTIGYIIVVAILSWFMARRISSWIQSIAAEPDQDKKEQ